MGKLHFPTRGPSMLESLAFTVRAHRPRKYPPLLQHATLNKETCPSQSRMHSGELQALPQSLRITLRNLRAVSATDPRQIRPLRFSLADDFVFLQSNSIWRSNA